MYQLTHQYFWKMMKICLLLCLCFVYVSTFRIVDSSQIGFKKRSTCVVASVNALIHCTESAHKALKDTFEALKNGGHKCFTEHGCELPHHEEKHDEKETKEHECIRDIHHARITNIEKCVEKATGLELPALPPHHDHHQHHGHLHGLHAHLGLHPHGPPPPGPPAHLPTALHANFGLHEHKPDHNKLKEIFEHILKKSCEKAPEGSAAKVEACLDFPKAKESAHKILQSFCEAKDKCFATSKGAGCGVEELKAEKEKAANEAHACFKSTEEPIDKLAAGVKECAGVDLKKFEEHVAKIKEHIEKAKAEHHKEHEGGKLSHEHHLDHHIHDICQKHGQEHKA